MLNFDPERYVTIQSGAVQLAPRIDRAIGELLADGATNVVFAGTGGAGILMQPAYDLLVERSSFPAFRVWPAETIVTRPAFLGPGSIVIIPSRSGNTTESVEMMRLAQAAGAHVIALVANDHTPLADGADVSFVNFAADDTSSESFYIQSLLVAISILRHRGEMDDYDGVVSDLQKLPSALLSAKSAYEPRAAELARAIQRENYHVFTGAGPTWGEAYYFGMCILEEMQWIRTRPVHASDFFHGTLELVEPDVSVFVLKGEDATRELCDRVERFLVGRTDRVRVIDSADFELAGLSPRTRALVSPAILAAALERLAAHLEVLRDHPLTTRRYYRQVSY